MTRTPPSMAERLAFLRDQAREHALATQRLRPLVDQASKPTSTANQMASAASSLRVTSLPEATRRLRVAYLAGYRSGLVNGALAGAAAGAAMVALLIALGMANWGAR